MECPLCNGFGKMTVICTHCESQMEDQGKRMDYDDDYSAYLDIDIQKQNDGDWASLRENRCLHLFKCQVCGHDEIMAINEINI